MNWMTLILIYGILSGFYFIFQKLFMRNNHSINLLVAYSSLSMIFVVLNIRNIKLIDSYSMILVAIKSLVLLIYFILSFKAMSKISVSLYGVINMSRILFTTLLGIIILNESFGIKQLIGMIIICIGLLLVNIQKDDKRKNQTKYVLLLFVACVFAAINGFLDKVISIRISPYDLQIWYLLFLFIYVWGYVLITKTKINLKNSLKNYWSYLFALTYLISDRILFMANNIKESEISIMSLLKQVSVIIMVLVGGKIFKEKNIKYKLLCCMIILIGLIIIVIGGNYE